MNPEGPTPPDASSGGLGADDRRILDLLADAGFDASAWDDLDPSDLERGRRLRGLLGLLNDYPVEDPEDTLVHATLARVDRADREARDRLRLEPAREARAMRIRRLPDLITAASLILIAASIIIPLTSNLHGRSIDLACEHNLRQINLGLHQYGEDNAGHLPIAVAGVGLATKVLDFGPVVTGGYTNHDIMDCPGACAEHANASYSRQVLPDTGRQWSNSAALVGDRNPLVDAYATQTRLDRSAPSVNHGGRGQNVLVGDGSVIWLETAYLVPSDCIWLPEGHDRLSPGIGPGGARDSFLLH